MWKLTTVHRFASQTSIVFILLWQGCVFDQRRVSEEVESVPNRGFYSVVFPGTGATLDLDSSYVIRWNTGDSMTIGPNDKPYAAIFLYRGDSLVQQLANFAEHRLQGQYSWELNAKRVPSGTNYRLKFIDPRKYGVWDFSNTFRIQSRYSGTLTVTEPVTGFAAYVDSALTLKWRADGNVGSRVKLGLYRNGTSVTNIVDSAPVDSGNFIWKKLSAWRGTGDDYRIKITSLSDPALFALGPEFRVATGFTGSFTLNSPQSTDTLVAGAMGQIAWTYTDSPAVVVRFELYRDTVFLPGYSFEDFFNQGTPIVQGARDWAIPGGISTSNRYRIRIVSKQDPSIFTYSPFFSIRGVDPDPFEPDDQLSQAGYLSPDGRPQVRNFSEYDQDWVRCNTEAGVSYGFSIQASSRVWVMLADETGDTVGDFGGFAGSWKAKYTGSYFLRLRTEVPHQPYSLTLIRFDSFTDPAVFFSPGQGSTWEGGDLQDVYWASDATRLDPWFPNPELFRDGVKVSTISCLQSTGPGRCSWIIPKGVATSNRFQIRIGNTALSVFTPNFTIRGNSQDVYEPDDSPAQAKSITAGGPPQSRSWTIFNPDWLRFNTRPGMHYVVGIRSEVYSYLHGYDGSAIRLNTLEAGYTFPTLIKPLETGPHFIRLEPANGLYGPYSLSLTEFDSASGPPSRLTSPDSVNGCPAGSACRITWIPDSTIFGDQVCLNLYLDTSYASNVTPAGTPNNGVYDWPVFQSFPPSTRYRIKIKNCYAPEIISAFGPYFSIP